ncbi:HIT-like domain-containing protein [Phlyctochytrium arcticum]|nr:HIT-like domain-containing protein [Phlyctochytrium arcticum]
MPLPHSQQFLGFLRSFAARRIRAAPSFRGFLVWWRVSSVSSAILTVPTFSTSHFSQNRNRSHTICAIHRDQEMSTGKVFQFGPWPIRSNEIFLTTKFSLGLVNYKPIVPGHVLIMPRRVVARFADLTSEEVSDLYLNAQAIGKVIEKEYEGTSLTFTTQDGPQAGQTVAHVHVHIIPRKKGDWANNDDIYPEIDQKSKEMVKELQEKPKGVDNEERKPRTQEDMAAESAKLRTFFTQFEDIWN